MTGPGGGWSACAGCQWAGTGATPAARTESGTGGKNRWGQSGRLGTVNSFLLPRYVSDTLGSSYGQGRPAVM